MDRAETSNEPEVPIMLLALCTVIMPLVGIIAGAIWVCHERPGVRRAGLSLRVMGLVMTLIACGFAVLALGEFSR